MKGAATTPRTRAPREPGQSDTRGHSEARRGRGASRCRAGCRGGYVLLRPSNSAIVDPRSRRTPTPSMHRPPNRRRTPSPCRRRAGRPSEVHPSQRIEEIDADRRSVDVLKSPPSVHVGGGQTRAARRPWRSARPLTKARAREGACGREHNRTAIIGGSPRGTPSLLSPTDPRLAAIMAKECVCRGTPPKSTGAALVLGGGVAGGIECSLDLANAGFNVYAGREDDGHRRPHGAARQDLPHQRLLDVHHLAQADRGRPAPQHRDLTGGRRWSGWRANRATSARECSSGPDSSTSTTATSCGECVEACPVAVPSEFDEGTSRARPSTSCIRKQPPIPTRLTRMATPPARRTARLETSAKATSRSSPRAVSKTRTASPPNPIPSPRSAAVSAPTPARLPARAAQLTRPSPSPALNVLSAITALRPPAREAAGPPRREGRHHRWRPGRPELRPRPGPVAAMPSPSSRPCRSPAACCASASPTTECRRTSCRRDRPVSAPSGST